MKKLFFVLFAATAILAGANTDQAKADDFFWPPNPPVNSPRMLMRDVNLPGYEGGTYYSVPVGGRVNTIELRVSGRAAVVHELRAHTRNGRVLTLWDRSRPQIEIPSYYSFHVGANVEWIEIVARNISRNRCCSYLSMYAY